MARSTSRGRLFEVISPTFARATGSSDHQRRVGSKIGIACRAGATISAGLAEIENRGRAHLRIPTLGRKLERITAMLLRLKDLRQGRSRADPSGKTHW